MRPNGPAHLPDAGYFWQWIPTCCQDKTGYYAAVLILQFVGGLQDGQLDALRERAPAYRKHLERHLGGSDQARERRFFQLLLLVIRCEFRMEVVKRKSAGRLNRLEKCVLMGEVCRSKVEIVPYEHLWRRVVALLSRNSAG